MEEHIVTADGVEMKGLEELLAHERIQLHCELSRWRPEWVTDQKPQPQNHGFCHHQFSLVQVQISRSLV
jgi:hypothetical protein